MKRMGDVVDVRPYELVQIVCRLGQGCATDMGNDRLTAILKTVRKNPATPIRMRTNTNTLYTFQNPGTDENTSEHHLVNVKRDLDIMQHMGLAPGATRPAIDLFRWLLQRLPSLESICGYASGGEGIWHIPPSPDVEYYECARKQGVHLIIPGRQDQEQARTKEATARDLYRAEVLEIRPHHLMCIACFDGNKSDVAPVAEDNLYEVIDIMRKNPDIPVRLIKGCCMICPPCPTFDPEHGICIGGNSMALRDEKKAVSYTHLRAHET